MPADFRFKQSLLLFLIGIFFLGTVSVSFYLVNRLGEANWWVEHTLQVQKEAQAALICLMDCETAYRGYLITSDSSYLQPYQNCYRHVASHLLMIQQLTLENSKQHQQMSSLLALADRKIKFSQMVIAARNQQPNVPASSLVELAPGKAIMDDFRKQIAIVMDEEQRLLLIRLETVERIRTLVYGAVIVLGCASVVFLLTLARDSRLYVAEQANIRAELAAARDEAVAATNQAQRASELKSQFVANVSHEIRTPMSGIIGLSEYLLQCETDADRKEDLTFIFEAASSLMVIVNDLLDFAKLEAGRMRLEQRTYSLADVVEQAKQAVAFRAREKDLHLQVTIDPELPRYLIGDSDRIKQVLLNLLHNSVKFTQQGAVSVAVQMQKGDRTNSLVHFAVTDTGIGIPEVGSEHLFEPFVQGDGSSTRKYGGTGLGLAICKEMVTLMGGSIGCSANDGGGATFWFSIPCVAALDAPTSQDSP